MFFREDTPDRGSFLSGDAEIEAIVGGHNERTHLRCKSPRSLLRIVLSSDFQACDILLLRETGYKGGG